MKSLNSSDLIEEKTSPLPRVEAINFGGWKQKLRGQARSALISRRSLLNGQELRLCRITAACRDEPYQVHRLGKCRLHETGLFGYKGLLLLPIQRNI